jgi:cytochrome c peroxidase
MVQNLRLRRRLKKKEGFFLGFIVWLLLTAVPAWAQADPSSNPFPYVDVTDSAGIQGPRIGNERITGQAWADYDGDGWVDLYLTDFGTAQKPAANRLYRNDGDGTFSLSPLAGQVALESAGSGGAVWADYNNDGWPDLYVTNWGANNLFRNEAGRGFTDVTEAAGVGDIANGKSASWGDFDGDGFLDLYVTNWSCTPKCGRPIEGDQDRLYRNNGDGTFTDLTSALSGKTTGAGFIAGFVDYDNDNDLDIYLVNDEFVHAVGNGLWRNDGPGCDGWCFTDVSVEAGANQNVMGMGLAVGDYDSDLDFDFYFSNVGPATLLQNQGDGTFVDVAPEAGVDTPKAIGWGTTFFDYDNDGRLDLYMAQMTRTDGGVGFNPLFRNNGDGTFTDIGDNSGAADPGKSIGVSTADFDRDGFMDLIVGNFDEGYRLYRNTLGDSGTGGNWFALNLVGDGSVNRDAVGVKVYTTSSDGRVQVRQVTNSTGLGGNSALELHFGLGEAEVESVRVRWPDGRWQFLDELRGNSRYSLTYGGEPVLIDSSPAFRLPSWWPWAIAIAAALIGVPLLYQLRNRLILPNTRPMIPRSTSLKHVRQVAGGTFFILLGGAAALLVWSSRDLLAERLGGSTPEDELALLLKKSGVTPLDLGPMPDPALVKLGEALFFDKELSGNRDISCATCHHPTLAGGDGLPLSFGTGGHGLGPGREPGTDRELIPRNAPELFNRGSPAWSTMFWDGRVKFSEVYDLDTPVGNGLPDLLQTVLAAQAMFPVTSRDEMRGNFGDYTAERELNELATISDMRPKQVWAALMRRLMTNPGYVELFQAAYQGVPVDEMGFEHAANAIAAYEIAAFSFADSPWDRYLNGDVDALSQEAERGAILFYGAAGCGQCHSGSLLTDQQFHNIGVPQLGPGKLDEEKHLDLGRFLETGQHDDRYAFRTPPLRNVTLTTPYMHNGAFATLDAAFRHHLNPTGGLQNYDKNNLPEYFRDTIHSDPELHEDILATLDPLLSAPPVLTEDEISDLMAFLEALTSPSAADLSHLVPASVPSGLPVQD